MAPIDKMATIEPRLIHLLNDNPQGRDQPSRDLPSIASLPAPGVSEWHSLPPLESDPIPRLPLPPPLPSSSNSTQIPGLHEAGIDVSRPLLVDNPYLNDGSQLISSARPLNLLLGEPHEAHTTTLSLRMLVDETTTDSLEDLATKKRHRAFTNKDDFAQLPQPLKKQKSTQQVMPPIIAGLNEPPPNPNASLFPPIAGGFDDNDTLGLGASLKDFSNSVEDLVTAATPLSDGDNKNNGVGSAKVKRRAAKPRRKWTEQETNALLLGVSKHGVGKWTSILEDPEFMFNERSAGDLKDRFRTCCPDELRGPSSTGPSGKKQRSSMTESNAGDQALYSQPPSANLAEESTVVTTASIPPPKSKSSLPLANILIEPEAASIPPAPPSSDQEIFYAYSYPHQHPDSDTTPGKQQRKSRAHRKKLEDLVALGIDGPFKKSRRRERRPFTEQDDKEILAGLERYGPAWTKIQRDTEYHLSSRQPTDLRDRVRNKYPDVYANMEHLNVKEGKAAGLLEPSINTVIERPTYNLPSNDLHNQSSFEDMVERAKHGELNRSTSKEEMSISGKGPGPGASLGTHMAHSDMDISRLLLDDSAQSTAAPRLPFLQSSGPGVGSHINQHYPYPQPHPARSGPGGGGTGVPPYNNMVSDRRYGTGR